MNPEANVRILWQQLPSALTDNELSALIMYACGGCQQAEIARALGVTQAGVSYLLHSVVKKGKVIADAL